jgi:hypothetical protein
MRRCSQKTAKLHPALFQARQLAVYSFQSCLCAPELLRISLSLGVSGQVLLQPWSSPVRIPVRGTAALATAIAIVVATLVWLPAYRWFFLFSVGIGLVVAGGLYLWHKLRPVREEDINNKRPLGL